MSELLMGTKQAATLYFDASDVCVAATFHTTGECGGNSVEAGEQVWIAGSHGVSVSEGVGTYVRGWPLGSSRSFLLSQAVGKDKARERSQ